MDEEIEKLVVSVRADTAGFARDVQAMKAELDGGLVEGAKRAGRDIENALVRALRTGRLGFEDLKRTALAAMAEIAAVSIRGGLGALLGGGGKSAAGSIGSLLAGLLGAPGRAIGGPVSPMRPYWVGERGPELFVPTASGRVEPVAGAGPGRNVSVTINLNAPAGSEARALQQSGRQVARAVKAALMRVED